MIEVKTEFPIAVDSLDHTHPQGVQYDNNISTNFMTNVENHFGRKINILDLGCAGGGLTVEMHKRGHLSVGIDGSDKCYNVSDSQLSHFKGTYPAGYDNWNNHLNKILFTADITKPYTILKNNDDLKFDLISAWDVLEHFEPEKVDEFLKQVTDKLKIGGMFIASIALFPDGSSLPWKDKPDINYHKSLFDKHWWIDNLNKHLTMQKYPFGVCNREFISPIQAEDGAYLVYAGIKI